jgi:hypothetical protein
MSFPKSAAVAALLSAAVAGSAAAQTLYEAHISGTAIDADGSVVTINQGKSFTTDPLRFGQTMSDWQVGANAIGAHGGTVESDIIMSPLPTVSGVGFATLLTSSTELIEHITLKGTASDPFVPVMIGTKGTVTWSQDGNAQANFFFGGPDGQIIFDNVFENDPGQNRLAGTESFAVNQVVDFIPGVTYEVVMTTSAQADFRLFQSNPDGTIPFGMDTAVVDPTFTVDPAFAARWSIDGVPVDDRAPGVPEPATWAMLITGFGLAGASLRRRRPLSAGRPSQ